MPVTGRAFFAPPWDRWDVGLAGPDWRLGQWIAQELDWCRMAYKEAGKAA